MSDFTSAGTTTTLYYENAEILPQMKIHSSKDNKIYSPLPRSDPSFTSHPYLTDIFGDDLLAQIPTVSVTSGSTDYLDLVKPEDFIDESNNPVFMAKGIDCFKRPFVTMGLQVNKKSDVDFCIDSKYYIYTIFRRYTDANSIWVICKSHYSPDGNHMVSNLLKCSTFITPEAKQILKKIIQDFKENNKGTELVYSSWNQGDEDYIMKFYRPNHILCSNLNK